MPQQPDELLFFVDPNSFCEDPGDIADGIKHPTPAPYKCGDQVVYECNTGYHMIGTPVMVCGTNGKFSPSKPMCKSDGN